MKKSLFEKFVALREKAVSILNRKVSKKKLILFSEQEMEKKCDTGEGEEKFYELPRTTHYGKYNSFDEYAIIEVVMKDNKLTFVGYSIDNEAQETTKEFELDDMTTGSLCLIADLKNP